MTLLNKKCARLYITSETSLKNKWQCDGPRPLPWITPMFTEPSTGRRHPNGHLGFRQQISFKLLHYWIGVSVKFDIISQPTVSPRVYDHHIDESNTFGFQLFTVIAIRCKLSAAKLCGSLQMHEDSLPWSKKWYTTDWSLVSTAS